MKYIWQSILRLVRYSQHQQQDVQKQALCASGRGNVGGRGRPRVHVSSWEESEGKCPGRIVLVALYCDRRVF